MADQTSDNSTGVSERVRQLTRSTTKVTVVNVPLGSLVIAHNWSNYASAARVVLVVVTLTAVAAVVGAVGWVRRACTLSATGVRDHAGPGDGAVLSDRAAGRVLAAAIVLPQAALMLAVTFYSVTF